MMHSGIKLVHENLLIFGLWRERSGEDLFPIGAAKIRKGYDTGPRNFDFGWLRLRNVYQENFYHNTRMPWVRVELGYFISWPSNLSSLNTRHSAMWKRPLAQRTSATLHEPLSHTFRNKQYWSCRIRSDILSME